MYILLPALFIITPTPDLPPNSLYCNEIRVILEEAVEEGLISINEAIEIDARCARAPEIEQNSP